MQALTSGNGNLVHGAMRVLTGIRSTLRYLDTVKVLVCYALPVWQREYLDSSYLLTEKQKRDVKIQCSALVSCG